MAIDIIARGLASSLIGSDGKIASDKLPVFGAVPAGANFYPVGALTDASLLEGKTAEEILFLILFGVTTPTLTAPSLQVSLDNTQIYAGRAQILSGTLSFNRGTIQPAYGTSGFRAGAPISYTIGDQVITSNALSYHFELETTPIEGVNSIICKVDYAEGEQPFNSTGEPYDAPLPAGSLTYILSFSAFYPPYRADGTEIELTHFQDTDGAGYQITTASELATGERSSFAIATTQTVIGIKQFDILSQDWWWIGGDAESSLEMFDTTVISKDSLGEPVDYIGYIYNGPQVGERQLRIYVTAI